jgi:DNA polymerase-3 subunit gamma/tau
MIVGGLPAVEVVGLAPNVGEGVADFVELLLEQKVGEAIKFVNRRYEEGSNLVAFNQTLLEYLRSLLLIQSQVGEELLEAPEENYKRMEEQVSKISARKLSFMLEEFTSSVEEFATASIPQLPLEMAVIKICDAFQATPSNRCGGGAAVAADPWSARGTADDDKHARGVQLPPPSAMEITSKWNNVLKAIKPFNHSLEALLRSVRAVKLEGGVLTLEVFYKFHKERLEEVRNRSLLEKTVSEMAKIPVKVRCILGEREKQPQEGAKGWEDTSKEALEVFNGEL